MLFLNHENLKKVYFSWVVYVTNSELEYFSIKFTYDKTNDLKLTYFRLSTFLVDVLEKLPNSKKSL